MADLPLGPQSPVSELRAALQAGTLSAETLTERTLAYIEATDAAVEVIVIRLHFRAYWVGLNPSVLIADLPAQPDGSAWASNVLAQRE